MHEIGRFSTTVLQAIYTYNKFIYFISVLLARIIVVLNMPISCTIFIGMRPNSCVPLLNITSITEPKYLIGLLQVEILMNQNCYFKEVIIYKASSSLSSSLSSLSSVK